jgi:hypothetical protein
VGGGVGGGGGVELHGKEAGRKKNSK